MSRVLSWESSACEQPLRFAAIALPPVRRPAEAIGKSRRKERAHARHGYGASTMVRMAPTPWRGGQTGQRVLEKTNPMCTPSAEVPGGFRFGGELMTDNSENAPAARLPRARRSSGTSIPMLRTSGSYQDRGPLTATGSQGTRSMRRACSS